LLRLVVAVEQQAAADSNSANAGSTAESRQQAWCSLCRVLLASNEFIYVE